MQTSKITTHLWFDTQAEEAAKFYVSIFKGDSRVLSVDRWGDGGPAPKGSVMNVTFQLAGQQYIGLNGGPHFKFNEAISLFVTCEDQAEVDRFWTQLQAEGGSPSQCGWCKDKYGLSWQIVPAVLMKLMRDPDPKRVARVTSALMGMTKLDIAALPSA